MRNSIYLAGDNKLYDTMPDANIFPAALSHQYSVAFERRSELKPASFGCRPSKSGRFFLIHSGIKQEMLDSDNKLGKIAACGKGSMRSGRQTQIEVRGKRKVLEGRFQKKSTDCQQARRKIGRGRFWQINWLKR